MDATCRRAVELALPELAFTEHCDFPGLWGSRPRPAQYRPFDVAGYGEALARCRAAFPNLSLLRGVELGDPHRFPDEAQAMLASAQFELVLGSVHCVEWNGAVIDLSSKGLITAQDANAILDLYLGEVESLLASEVRFDVLSHLGYLKRYWPHEQVAFDERAHEQGFRSVLRSAAERGVVLEINTTRGAEPRRGLCPGPDALTWWREEGGRRLSFGSDSHHPGGLQGGFAEAERMAEAAGFKRPENGAGFWTA